MTDTDRESGETELAQPAPEPSRPRRRRLLYICVLVLLLGAFARVCTRPMRGPLRGPEHAHKLVFAPTPYTHDLPGRLDVYAANWEIPGARVETKPPYASVVLGRERNLIVYTPDAIDATKADAPLILLFHGYLDTPVHMLATTLRPLADEMARGTLPPSVVAIPDVSIGGTGTDDPATPLDERLGHWGVDSNLGRFSEDLLGGVIPFVRERYPVRTDADGTVLMGYSVGGYIAVSLALREARLARTVVAISPALDTRYAIDGERLAPYDEARYRPIEEDRPDRVILRAGRIGRFTDRWAFWPVFDSDARPGPVWNEDRPVWERLRETNPPDLLAPGGLDLNGRAFYIVAGDKDVYFFQHHIGRFAARARQLGARVEPADPVRPGAHSLMFVSRQIPDAAKFLGSRLAAKP